MKKVFAYIGSQMREKSCTAALARRILEEAAKKLEGGLEYEVVTPDQVTVLPCKGCCNCFRYCECPQDQLDDMAAIKEKMLAADFIIWGSPVYAHQVSGQTKIFIDRISYWFHLLQLAGKKGLVLSTTSGSGYREVLHYLSKLMYYTGMKPVGGYNVNAYLQGSFADPNDLEQKVEKAADLICRHLQDPAVKVNKLLEEIFQANKQQILAARELKPGEYAFWESRDYLDCGSFQELLTKKENYKK